jgi:hypothetical protein
LAEKGKWLLIENQAPLDSYCQFDGDGKYPSMVPDLDEVRAEHEGCSLIPHDERIYKPAYLLVCAHVPLTARISHELQTQLDDANGGNDDSLVAFI